MALTSTRVERLLHAASMLARRALLNELFESPDGFVRVLVALCSCKSLHSKGSSLCILKALPQGEPPSAKHASIELASNLNMVSYHLCDQTDTSRGTILRAKPDLGDTTLKSTLNCSFLIGIRHTSVEHKSLRGGTQRAQFVFWFAPGS